MRKITHKEFMEALHIVRLYGKQVSSHLEELRADMDSVSRYVGMDPDIRICELPLSKRALNVLKQLEELDFENDTVEALGNISLQKLRNQKNAGRKTLYELEEFFMYTGLKVLP